MFEVIQAELETSVQELPGRIGFWEQGFPPSGPVDSWSFRLANLLVGNRPDAAALECQGLGPALRLKRDGFLAVTGADMAPTLNGTAVRMWRTLPVRDGDVLALGGARMGARSYIAVAGAIDTPPVLGSRATFHMAGVGGLNGYALEKDQKIPLGKPSLDVPLREFHGDKRPPIGARREWTIECMLGPNDDWLEADTIATFCSADWVVQAKSSRTGMRLTGPKFAFAARAYDKRPERGHDPSNILDHEYPLGAINLAGQTPIINDAPSTGGFINPFTVPSAAFSKLGQVQPHQILRFRRVTWDDAQALRRALDVHCSLASVIDL